MRRLPGRDAISQSYHRSLRRALSALIHAEATRLQETGYDLDATYGPWILHQLRRHLSPVQWAFSRDLLGMIALESGLEASLDFEGGEFDAFTAAYIRAFNSSYAERRREELASDARLGQLIRESDEEAEELYGVITGYVTSWPNIPEEARRCADDIKESLSSSHFREWQRRRAPSRGPRPTREGGHNNDNRNNQERTNHGYLSSVRGSSRHRGVLG